MRRERGRGREEVGRGVSEFTVLVNEVMCKER